MAFTQLTDDLDFIQKLDDEPNDVGGLSAAQLKTEFDKAGNAIKAYINAILLNELEGTNAASYLGVSTDGELGDLDPAPDDIQAALEAILLVAQNAQAGELTPGIIDTIKLANGAVTTDKIANSAVTTGKLADAAVTAAKIASGGVSAANLAGGAVTTEKLGDGAVATAKLATNAVTTEKLNSGAVTAAKIGPAAVETAKIKDENVTTPKIADGAVTQAKLGENAVSTLYTATIGTTWTDTEGAAPYSQAISVPGLLASDTPIVDIVPSSVYATAENELDAWADIYKFVAGDDTLTVYAHTATETEITIKVLCVRR